MLTSASCSPDLLRAALVDLVTECGPRRVVPALLRLGTPGGEHRTFPDEPGYDAGLRADVLERALDGYAPDEAPPHCWLTRAGELSPGDLDFAWFVAARDAFGRHGLALTGFNVMTRRGWLDLVAGEVTLLTVRPRRRRRAA